MKCARNKTTCARSVKLFVDVHVVKRHAIVDVLCGPVVNVVIGVHVFVHSVPLVVVRFCRPCCDTVSIHPNSVIVAFFHLCFHCIFTAFQVWYLHTPSVTVDRCQL